MPATLAHSPEAIGWAQGSTWDLDDTADRFGWAGVAIVPGISRTRDSHAFETSNMIAALAIMLDTPAGEAPPFVDGGTRQYGPDGAVAIVNLRHWAIGWTECLAYDAERPELRERAAAIVARLADYPLLDETDAYDREYADDHPNGTRIGDYCYAESGEQCHATDSMGRIVQPRDARGRFLPL